MSIPRTWQTKRRRKREGWGEGETQLSHNVYKHQIKKKVHAQLSFSECASFFLPLLMVGSDEEGGGDDDDDDEEGLWVWGGKVHPSVWAEDVLWNSNKFPRFFCCTHELRQHCSRFGVDNSLLLPDQVAKWASQLGGNEFAAGASLTRFDKRNAFTGFQTEGKWFATCNSQTKSRMGSIMKRKGRNTLLNFTQNLLIQSRCTAQAHTKTYKSTLVPVA